MTYGYDIPLEGIESPIVDISERYHPLMDIPLQLKDGSSDSVLNLAGRAFKSNEFGLHMNTQPYRFSERYGYEPERSLDELGADIHPVGHQYELGYHLANILEVDAERLGLTQNDIAIVMLAALIHDMGETTHPHVKTHCGNVVGDIAFGLKTDKDRLAEAGIREYLYNGLLADVPFSTKQRVEAIISHKDETILHDLFEAAHELQTYETTRRASAALNSDEGWRAATAEEPLEILTAEKAKRISGLNALSSLVLAECTPNLSRHAKTFNHVKSTIQAESIAA
jgi:hypothetical protein